jgi:acyl carrier protein
VDLGFDSLDTMTLLFELENTFQISIPDEQARSIRTVSEIVEGVRALKNSAPIQPASAG